MCLIFPENCCNHQSIESGLKLYDFTIVAAGVEINRFVQSVRTTEPSCACSIELKTEFELGEEISMQLRNKITIVKNMRIHHLKFGKRKALSLEVAEGLVKTLNAQTTRKAFQLILHSIRFVSDNVGAVGTQSYNECR